MDTTNEPVAWLIQTKTAHQFTFKEPTIIPIDAFVIPLYTSPRTHDLGIADAIGFERGYKAATVKELTDEEIVSLYESSYLQSGLDEWEFDPVYFARAILRKAQEK